MPNFTASQFRDRSNQMVGVPYVLGAEWSASCVAPCRPVALDCSELVEGVFRENGTPIGDLAAAQYDKTVAAAEDTRVGDLVFLRNNTARWNGIGHVAVITAPLADGDWEVIESRGRAAGTVRTTLSYWRTRAYFTGVRRFPGFSLVTEASPLTTHTTVPAPEVLKRAPRRCANTYTTIVQEICGAHADGIWGKRSDTALRDLQTRLGVKRDGDWGPVTAEAYLLSLGNLRHGDRGPAIKLLQFIGGVAADGVWGPVTDGAVGGLQAWAGLDTDLVVGKLTKKAVTI